MAKYTIVCRQVLEYEAVVEADTEELAKWEAAQECRRHGEMVDQDLQVVNRIDYLDEEADLNDYSLFATEPR